MIGIILSLLFASHHAKSKYDKFQTTQFNEYVSLIVRDEAAGLIVLLDGVYSCMLREGQAWLVRR